MNPIINQPINQNNTDTPRPVPKVRSATDELDQQSSQLVSNYISNPDTLGAGPSVTVDQSHEVPGLGPLAISTQPGGQNEDNSIAISIVQIENDDKLANGVQLEEYLNDPYKSQAGQGDFINAAQPGGQHTDPNVLIDANQVAQIQIEHSPSDEIHVPPLPPNIGSGDIFYSDDPKGFKLSASRLISLEDSYKHIAIMGESGSGKKDRFLKHSILSLTDQNSLVTDIDGTLYTSTAHLKRREGYTVKVLDLINGGDISNSFNPFLKLSLDDDCEPFLNCLFESVNMGTNKIFVEGGKHITEFALQLLIYESGEDSNASLPSLPALYEKVMSFDHETITELLNRFKNEHERDPENKIMKKLYHSSNAVFKDAKAHDEAWMYAKLVLKPLADSVFQRMIGNEGEIFDSISDPSKKTIVYLKVAGAKVHEYATVMALFFQHYFQTVKGIVAEEKKKFPDRKDTELNIRPTLCFLDDFGSFKINNFYTEITSLRKFKIGCMVALQAGKQLEEKYGKHQAAVIADAFETKIYLNIDPNDPCPEFLHHDEDKLDQLENINGNRAELEVPPVSLDNIRKLDHHHAILVKKGMAPIKYETLHYKAEIL